MEKDRIICLLIAMFGLICVLTANGDSSVIVYSMPGCKPCKLLKQYLAENNISFTEFNVVKDKAAAEEMSRKSGQGGVPVLDVNGTIFVGFGPVSKQKICRLLNLQKSVSESNTVALEKPTSPKYERIPLSLPVLKEIVGFAEEKAVDLNAVDILKKLSDAHVARIVYETSFTDQFRKRIEEMSSINENEKHKAFGTSIIVVSDEYFRALAVFHSACQKNIQAANEARQALKFGMAQKINQDEKKYGYSNLEMLRNCWLCVAVNPKTGDKLQQAKCFAGNQTGSNLRRVSLPQLNPERDAATIEAIRILNEIASTHDGDNVIEPNDLMASNIQKTN